MSTFDSDHGLDIFVPVPILETVIETLYKHLFNIFFYFFGNGITVIDNQN